MNEGERVAKILRAVEGLEKEVPTYTHTHVNNITAVCFQGITQQQALQTAKAKILMENALDWKKFKVLTSLCCTYVVSTHLCIHGNDLCPSHGE